MTDVHVSLPPALRRALDLLTDPPATSLALAVRIRGRTVLTDPPATSLIAASSG